MTNHKIERKDIINLIIILATSAIASFQSIFFYFWHDDYSIFHCARSGLCPFNFPYMSYTVHFTFYDRFFNYNATLYFISGFILFLISSVVVYIFIRQFYSSVVALYSTLIYASVLIAQNVFQEAYSSITSFLSIIFLFLSIIFIKKTFETKKREKYVWFIATNISFYLSIIALRARSVTYFLPLIAYIILFGKKISKTKKALFSIYIFLFHLFFYYIYPAKALGSLKSKSSGVTIELIIQKISYFLKFVGSIFVSDIWVPKFYMQLYYTNYKTFESYLLIIGIITLIIGLFPLKLLKGNNLKIYIFGIFLILSLYFPYGWVSGNWRILSTHRYFIFLLVGISLTWASLHNLKYWKYITIIIASFGMISTLSFLHTHLLRINKQESFYTQMHSLVSELHEGDVVFVDYPNKEFSTVNDFFTVGATPPVSAVATEYGLKHTDLYLVNDSRDIITKVREGNLDFEKLESFYYENGKLVYTKPILKKILETKHINNNPIKNSFIQNYSAEANAWKGKVDTPTFTVKSFSPVFPYTLKAQITAYPVDFPTPYAHSGRKIKPLDFDKFSNLLNFLTISSHTKSIVTTTSSSNNYGLVPDLLLDENIATYWAPHINEWLDNETPSFVNFNFKEPVNLSGVEIKVQGSPLYIAEEHKVLINGAEVPHKKTMDTQMIRLDFESENVKDLRIELVSTPKNDVPVMYEVYFIPYGMADITTIQAKTFALQVSDSIPDEKYKTSLNNYLKKGVEACIEWKSTSGERGMVPLILYVDSQPRVYEVILPAKGVDFVELKMGCLNFPITAMINSVELTPYLLEK